MRASDLPRRDRRDERGVVLPTALLVLCLLLVASAAVGFILTVTPTQSEVQVAAARATPTSTPTVSATPTPRATPKPKPIDRGQVYVEVYNNSGVAGLASRVAGEAVSAGWNVVGSDNWYGTIVTSTVYYPPRLEREAELLAKDLGIGRLKPAIEPMRFDRLTVIMTG